MQIHWNYTIVFCKQYMHMYFVFTQRVETLHKINQTVYISFLDACIFYLHDLYPATEEKEMTES